MIIKEEFTLTGAAGKTIAADHTYDDQNTNSDIIIFIHGFKGFKDWGAHNIVSTEFAKKGYRYIKFNGSHSGVTLQNPNDVTDFEAFASNTFSKELTDINTVINDTAEKYPNAKISLIGHSRGGGLAIITAARDKRVSKLITWSSIADFSSLWKKEQEKEWESEGKIYVENARTKEKMPLDIGLLEDFRAHKKELNILDAAEKINIPWLILHGDDDVNVDFSVAQQLAQRQITARIQKIGGANHVFGASHPYSAEQLPIQLEEVVQKSLGFISQ